MITHHNNEDLHRDDVILRSGETKNIVLHL